MKAESITTFFKYPQNDYLAGVWASCKRKYYQGSEGDG